MKWILTFYNVRTTYYFINSFFARRRSEKRKETSRSVLENCTLVSTGARERSIMNDEQG